MTLEERVFAFVAANPGETVDDVAREVRARTAEVRDVLIGERFSSSLRGAYPSDRALVYRLASRPSDGSGRANRRSQESKIEGVLADGRWHTASEIHQRCGFCRLNSRISSLRNPKKRGLNIECERINGVPNGPDAYRYRLAGTSEAGDGEAPVVDSVARATPLSPASDASVPRDSEDTGGASDTDGQLRLDAAA